MLGITFFHKYFGSANGFNFTTFIILKVQVISNVIYSFNQNEASHCSHPLQPRTFL